MKIIFDTTGRCIGTHEGAGDFAGEGRAIDAPDGFRIQDAIGWTLGDDGPVYDPGAALSRLRGEKVAAIKAEAATRIAALDWRLERAREREAIGAAGESVAEVMREREAIRAASNRAGEAILEIDDAAELAAFAWDVTDEDRAVPPRPRILGKGEFLDLFVQAGVTVSSIRAASDDPELADVWWALDRMYATVRKGHPATVAGVEAMVARKHVTRKQADAVWASWPAD